MQGSAKESEWRRVGQGCFRQLRSVVEWMGMLCIAGGGVVT